MSTAIFGMTTTGPSTEYTRHALKSFFRHTSLNEGDQFYLIDNDNHWNRADSAQYPQITLIRNQAPKSFAANMNQILCLALDRRADLYFLNNDLIFSPEWITPLKNSSDEIISPLSNLEAQYRSNVFNTTKIMCLDDYLGHEENFIRLIEAHLHNLSGYRSVLTCPFFCIKIPYAILSAVGLVDEEYGVGGGEDYDYCLRTYLAGYTIRYALASYVIHFGGRSSWAGVQNKGEREAIELALRTRFAIKWGFLLLRMILFEQEEAILKEHPEAKLLSESRNYRELILMLQAAGLSLNLAS